MHRWSWIALFSFMLTPACGGDDGATTNSNGGSGGDAGSAGEGGSAGDGGSAGANGGSAGSGASAGNGGNAGVGGDAGSGGSAANGGNAGVGGDAGSGGSAANGGSAGVGGDAGSGGSSAGGTAGAGASGGTSGAGGAAGAGGTAGTAGSGGTAGTSGSGGTAGASGSGGSGGGNPGTSCTAGARRCNGTGVEVCNSSGSAWLHIESCSQSCSAGLCTGGCTPGAERCNGNQVQQCNGGGSGYTTVETCSSFCDVPSAQCAVAALEITGNEDYDGTLVVAGALVVRSGATLNSPTGNLTIIADSIVVENGGSIAVAPSGAETAGNGGDGNYNYNSCGSYRYGGGGGGYGTNGLGATGVCGGQRGLAHGQTFDGFVTTGSRGGDGYLHPSSHGIGGGVLRLIAPTITIAGQLSANGQNGAPVPGSNSWGGGGGGSGGGILVAADILTMTGSISSAGGTGGAKSSTTYSVAGSNGGNGRVKLLYGFSSSITGSVSGATTTQDLLPPLTITSSSHPRSDLIYNDDFPQAYVTWNRAFPSLLGYYQLTNTTVTTVPTPATGNFLDTESMTVDRTSLVQGSNYFHLATIDGTSDYSDVQSWFRIQVNTAPPSMASSSHASQTAWSANDDVFYSWTFPIADANLVGAYWVRDLFADTVPTAADNFLPVSSKQLIQSNLPSGVHFLHLVSVDSQGYLTKQAGHYQVRIGADPGVGVLLGQVIDHNSQPVSGATVQINRGLASQTTNGTGNYNFTSAIAGTAWEIRVRKAGYVDAVASANILAAGSTTRNFQLTPIP